MSMIIVHDWAVAYRYWATLVRLASHGDDVLITHSDGAMGRLVTVGPPAFPLGPERLAGLRRAIKRRLTSA